MFQTLLKYINYDIEPSPKLCEVVTCDSPILLVRKTSQWILGILPKSQSYMMIDIDYICRPSNNKFLTVNPMTY